MHVHDYSSYCFNAENIQLKNNFSMEIFYMALQKRAIIYLHDCLKYANGLHICILKSYIFQFQFILIETKITKNNS